MSSYPSSQYYSFLINQIEYYGCLVLVNIGLIANLLNILISLRKNIQKITMGFYNVVMSVFNILLLIIAGYLNIFPQALGRAQFISNSYYGCNILSYLLRTILQMTQWLNVLITLDRTICVTFPTRFLFIKNKRKLLQIVLAMFVIICILNVINVFFHIEDKSSPLLFANETFNYTVCTSNSLVNLLSATSAMITRIIVPLTLQVVMNAVLIYKLFKIKRSVNVSRSLVKEYKFAVTVVVINGTFVASEIPFLVMLTLITVYGYNQSFIMTGSPLSNQLTLAYVCSYVFSAYTSISLFFINVFFNRYYKNEVKSILCKKLKISPSF